MKFSVLMSVYAKESPKNLKEALESLKIQERKADELVLVKDGILTSDLDKTIDRYLNILNIKVVALDKNIGLGLALAKGLKECSYDFVARMDSDDICREDRFIKQINFLEENPEIDVVGSFIGEFEDDPEKIYAYRILKTQPKELEKIARYRCPLNHVSVIFKKQSVLSVGNYQSFLGIEDYELWARMLLNGAKFANIAEPLVFVRGGISQILRRSGIEYWKKEVNLQKRFLSLGFTTFWQTFLYLIIRFPVRFAPNFIKMFIYKKLIRKSG